MLKSPFLAQSDRVRRAASNSPVMAQGENGSGVAILQSALIDLGYKLPVSMKKTGTPDGIYGQETHDAVVAFQRKQLLASHDGVAGRHTFERIDELLMASAPPTKPPPAVIPSSTLDDYKLGADDPTLGHDAGAGAWNSKEWTVKVLMQKELIMEVLPPRGMSAVTFIGGDATKHMLHYMDATGTTYTIDLEGMVRDVPSAKERFENEVIQAKRFVEMLPVGTQAITSRNAENGYNYQKESRNWFFAIGGYSSWGKGVATVKSGPGGREYVLDFEYKFYDRYNWDAGKSVTFAGITITDEFMGEFHRQGIAREYDCVGSFKRRFTWKHGQIIPPQQYQRPGGR